MIIRIHDLFVRCRRADAHQLPALAADLDASTSQLQWMANSYNLVLAALLLPAGMLGDR